jgi:hypothetical protein
MAKKKEWPAVLALVAFVIASAISPRVLGRVAAAKSAYAGKFPVFEVDPAWSQLPSNWVLGAVSKVAVDRHDNVWIIHRPRTVPASKTAAPPVVELAHPALSPSHPWTNFPFAYDARVICPNWEFRFFREVRQRGA